MMVMRNINLQNKRSAASASWMVIFVDLLALLLAFFVLLFSMNRIDFPNWNSMVETMSNQFNPKRTLIEVGQKKEPVDQQNPSQAGRNLTYLMALLKSGIQAEPDLSGIEVYQSGPRLAIAVPADFLFTRKSILLAEGAEKRITAIGNLLFQLPNRVFVVGHTNPQRINPLPAAITASDPSLAEKGNLIKNNWHLSLERSRLVSDILQNSGYRRPVTALGYGFGRYRDISPLLSTEKRNRWAERIDFILISEAEDFNPFAPQP